MSIYRTRMQFCVENQNALGKSGVSGYLPWAKQSNPNTSDTQSTPKNPTTSSSGHRDFEQQSVQCRHRPWFLDQPPPLSECSPREDRKVFPLDEGQKQGNIFSCGYSHVWDIVQLSRKKMVLKLNISVLKLYQASNSALMNLNSFSHKMRIIPTSNDH